MVRYMRVKRAPCSILKGFHIVPEGILVSFIIKNCKLNFVKLLLDMLMIIWIYLLNIHTLFDHEKLMFNILYFLDHE